MTPTPTPAPARKVISLMHVSLDGFAAGPNGELEWAIVNEELYGEVAALLATVGTALYGRVTYQMMESYWPTVPADPASTESDRHHARWVEAVEKITFSRTLERVTWHNTRLVKDEIGDEVARLKRQPGGDMMIFGSPSIVHTLAPLGLIDEYRLFLNPTALGGGTPLFTGSDHLELLEAKAFRFGVVALHYRTKPAGASNS